MTRLGCGTAWSLLLYLVVPNAVLVVWKSVSSRAEGIHGDLDQNKHLRVPRDFKNGNLDVLVATERCSAWVGCQVWLMSITTIFHKIPENLCHRIGRTQVVLVSQASRLLCCSNEMGYLPIMKTWPRNAWKVSNLQVQKKPSSKKTRSSQEKLNVILQMRLSVPTLRNLVRDIV